MFKRTLALAGVIALAGITLGASPASAAEQAASAVSTTAVINDVSTSGVNPATGALEANREYFEIRNISAGTLDINGYNIVIYAQVGTPATETRIVDYKVPAGTPVLAAKDNLNVGTPAHADQFWTVRHASFPGAPAGFDDTYTMAPAPNTLTNVPEAFSIEVWNGDADLTTSIKLDALSTDLASTKREGAQAVAEPFGSPLSVSRNLDSTDTDVNAADFALRRESPEAVNV